MLLYSVIYAFLVAGSDLHVSQSLEGIELLSSSLFYKGLQQGQVICRYMRLPPDLNRVVVKASVVALTGSPTLFGSWDEDSARLSVMSYAPPKNSGGYHILEQVLNVPNQADKYYFCVTTFSTEGTDFSLTASISGSSFLHQAGIISIQPEIPLVWQLDGLSARSVELQLIPPGAWSSIAISVTPIDGEVDLKVRTCDERHWLAASEADGADVIIVPTTSCLVVIAHIPFRYPQGHSIFSLVTYSPDLGPFTAQGLFIASLTDAKNFAKFKTLTSAADLFLTSSPSMTITATNGSDTWSTSQGRLEISRESANTDTIYSTITGTSPGQLVSLMSLAADAVATLYSGISSNVVVDTPRRFRDFRFWVPQSPLQIISIQGDASDDGSGLAMFVDSVMYAKDPRGYKWNTMQRMNTMYFTSTPSTEPDLYLLPCTNCYLYLSVKSCQISGGKCDESQASQFKITVSSDAELTTLEDGRILTIWINQAKRFKSAATSIVAVTSVNALLTASNETDSVSCETGSQCRIGSNMYINVTAATYPAKITVWAKLPMTHISLSNHQTVNGSLVRGERDSFRYFIPPISNIDPLSTLIEFQGDILNLTCGGETHSLTSAGVVPCDTVSNAFIFATVQCTSPTCNYSIRAASVSSSNSLRVGFAPVKFKLSQGEGRDWRIGYSESDAWMIKQSGDNTLRMCIGTYCCYGTCELEGFGRQITTVTNTAKSQLIGEITSKRLASLVPGVWLDLRSRASRIFKLPETDKMRLRTDPNDASVMYSSNLTSPFTESTRGDALYVTSLADRILLELETPLHLNEWKDSPTWVTWEHAESILVESCAVESPVIIDSSTMSFSARIDAASFPDKSLTFSSAGPFRVSATTAQDLAITATPDFVYFTAPTNADGSLYRAVASETAKSPCILERSAQSLGEWAVCIAGSPCAAYLPLSLDDTCYMVTVEAQGGDLYGRFEMINTCGMSATILGSLSVNIPRILRWLIFILLIALFVIYLFSPEVSLHLISLMRPTFRWVPFKKLKNDSLEAPIIGGYSELSDMTTYRKSSRTALPR